MSATWMVLYRLGVRLTQARIALSSQTSEYDEELEAEQAISLSRVASCLGDSLDSTLLNNEAMRHASEELRRRWQALNLSDNLTGLVRKKKHILTLLATFQQFVLEVTSCEALSEASRGFLLGLEVPDGCDQWSEGRPRLRSTGSAARQTLGFSRPRKHKWIWKNQRVVTTRLKELELTQTDVLSPDKLDVEPYEDLFGGVDPAVAWGWRRIELAMSRLATRDATPRWNGEDRTLTVSGVVVRTYRSPAEKQTAVLQAFEGVRWAKPIDCPFGDPRTRNLTVRDLNASIKPALIHFVCDGAGRIGWNFTRSVQRKRR